MHLDPKHLSVINLLQGRLFRIPDYQRAYAWGRKQRDDLFNDIREVQHSGRSHFMATVVCLARDKRLITSDEFQVADVVDGQQRLTTLIILLKAIEKTLNTDDAAQNKIKRELGELLVKGDDHSLLLLQTNHDSSSLFSDYIKIGNHKDEVVPLTLADSNLVDAMKDCEKFVREWANKYSLIDLVTILKNKMSVIYHEIKDEGTVYRVFEVLNSRGLDVKWIDKLKSQLMALIFEHAEGGTRDEALNAMKVIWQDIYRVLGLRSQLGDEALRFSGTWKIREQTNRILGEEDAASALATAAGGELKSVLDIAQWLKTVVEVVNKLEANVRLRAVTRISHARFVATAILLRNFPRKVEQRLLGEWERVTFRIFGLAGADTRHKVGEYVRLGHRILAESLSPDHISSALSALGKDYSINSVLEDADWSDSYNGWEEQLRYILFRYDEYLAREAGEMINDSQWNKIWTDDASKSIEHIQPQSSNFKYIHDLGNLTMLPPGVNSSLKDRTPKDKANKYSACGIRATAAVGKTIARNGWNKESVKKRTRDIEDFIRKEWAD